MAGGRAEAALWFVQRGSTTSVEMYWRMPTGSLLNIFGRGGGQLKHKGVSYAKGGEKAKSGLATQWLTSSMSSHDVSACWCRHTCHDAAQSSNQTSRASTSTASNCV